MPFRSLLTTMCLTGVSERFNRSALRFFVLSRYFARSLLPLALMSILLLLQSCSSSGTDPSEWARRIPFGFYLWCPLGLQSTRHEEPHPSFLLRGLRTLGIRAIASHSSPHHGHRPCRFLHDRARRSEASLRRHSRSGVSRSYRARPNRPLYVRQAVGGIQSRSRS